MANETAQYLVEFRHEGEPQFQNCETLEEALRLIRGRAEAGNFDCALWQLVPFTVTVGIDLASSPRRKRKDSPAPEQAPQTTPAAGATPKAGDVRPPAAAAPAAPPAPPPAPGPVRPSCGGKACETREDGKEIHRSDPSCAKFATTRKLAR